MQAIIEKVSDVVAKENAKSDSTLNTLQEFVRVVDNLEKMGYVSKRGYFIPPVDTIGKTYYNKFNKRSY
ncbi:hypothetical protein SAMN05518672_101667 [Chitinophaga sp. CF118]|uniref:hypothetical protein n=1 Tax=Chitinophaga sp. CF118 TaxID=1884367 RepID=UPI0008E8B5FF|nr:hypothetical protein [Chitinophaga sp. CF118]SFD13856.1 hypothetical protein SAMN05518672_101667 [Chitinophaga sp. CF118]